MFMNARQKAHLVAQNHHLGIQHLMEQLMTTQSYGLLVRILGRADIFMPG